MSAPRSVTVVLLALAALLALPAGVAWACADASPGYRSATGPRVNPIELSYPGTYIGTRAAWGIEHESWLSVLPRLDEWHAVTGPRPYANAPERDSSIISIWHPWPGGPWEYQDDHDPATPECEMDGKPAYRKPIVLVRETSKAVFITTITRYNTGSREGCERIVPSADFGCRELQYTNVGLKAPVGDRNVILAGFE